jgi:guanine deaminase
MELIRACVLHTTGNPLFDEAAFVSYDDGGLLIEGGRIRALGHFDDVRAAYGAAPVTDWRGGFVLPGLVDAHVHFPQIRVLGRLGLSLLEWLDQAALPEEARMADIALAGRAAERFVRALLAHGTTAASVFGSHFAPAVASLFEAADRAGLRISTGLVLADRRLRPELHSSLEAAYEDSRELIHRFHERGRSRYSVTPRFALSTTEGMLDVCRALIAEHPTVAGQTHINEQVQEILEVSEVFPWASDYLAVYERFGLIGPRVILAHDVHPTTSELDRLAASGTSVAHCPSSNAALGSGIFPFRRHMDAGVRCALGSDVGGGTGLGMLKEGLQAYLMQRVSPDPYTIPPALLLYLVTRAGAEALQLDAVTGDFQIGKAADLVYVRPPDDSVLRQVLDGVADAAGGLAALFTLAGSESIREVRIEGSVVYRQQDKA